MKILVGWDDASEAETIELILNPEDTEATVITDAAEFEQAASSGRWDTVVLSLNFPNPDDALRLFRKVREVQRDTPIIGAWHQGEVSHLAKFISEGLSLFLTRDKEGEFIFLLTPLVEAAQAAAEAQRSRLLAARLREEVDSVRRLQESVIPRDLPSPGGYRVAARYEPSEIRVVGANPVIMAGGDYYDVFALDSDTMILLVGDASGHGVKACMSIMTMHTLIRMIRGRRYPNTVEFVGDVNHQLCSSDIVRDEGGFITLLYCVLNTSTNELQWTSAGHPMPLLQNLGTNEVIQLGSEEEGGLPLGIDEDWAYEMCSFNIPDNSRLLLFSDGLDEAFPEGGEEQDRFGLKGIIATLQETAGLPLEQAVARLFEASHDATGGCGRHDDTSVVLLERRPTNGS